MRAAYVFERVQASRKEVLFAMVLLACALACAFLPETALADQVTAQGKQTVYVLSSVTETQADVDSAYTNTKTFTYTAKGLLKKRVTTGETFSGIDAGSTSTWAYKNGAIVKIVRRQADSDRYGVSKFTYNAKGLMTKEAWASVPAGNDTMSTSFVYTKAGRMTKLKLYYSYQYNGEWMNQGPEVFTYAYNAKGLVKTVKTNTYGVRASNYTYDAQSNLKKATTKDESGQVRATTYKNIYDDNGLLTKRVVKGDGLTCTYAYEYKAVSVPAAKVATVQAQQWGLINENLNFAVGGYILQ